MQRGELRRAAGERVLEEIKPLLEAAGSRGRVENQECHLVPEGGLVLAADNADRALELLAINPRLAIERRGRQSLNEPCRGVVKVSLARQELFPVPVSPHAVELLAHPPAGEIG